MRRPLIIALCAIFAGCMAALASSTTIELEHTGYELRYSMMWGLGMNEEFSLTHQKASVPPVSSGKIEIWKRPYNSGMAVYRSVDGKTYYFGLGYKAFIFTPTTGILRADTCAHDLRPAYTALGEKLAKLKDYSAIEADDPGYIHLFSYIEAETVAPLYGPFPASRYYTDLAYLGKFGLIRSEGRGEKVGFAPFDKVPEPRLALDFSCG